MIMLFIKLNKYNNFIPNTPRKEVEHSKKQYFKPHNNKGGNTIIQTKKLVILTLIVILSASRHTELATYAKETTDAIILSRDNAYYDDNLNAYVITFKKNPDNTITYLSNATECFEFFQTDILEADNEITPYDYREWYTFTPNGSYTKTSGKVKKISADFTAPNAGGSITKTVSFTISHSFSSNVTTEIQKSDIQAGCGFTWVKSATASTTYTAYLDAGETGYLSFTPYYNKISGSLNLHSNWDGLISTKSATGYSVKRTADGEPDGLYKFVYY